jgi:hypothetical protein
VTIVKGYIDENPESIVFKSLATVADKLNFENRDRHTVTYAGI